MAPSIHDGCDGPLLPSLVQHTSCANCAAPMHKLTHDAVPSTAVGPCLMLLVIHMPHIIRTCVQVPRPQRRTRLGGPCCPGQHPAAGRRAAARRRCRACRRQARDAQGQQPRASGRHEQPHGVRGQPPRWRHHEGHRGGEGTGAIFGGKGGTNAWALRAQRAMWVPSGRLPLPVSCLPT